MQKAAFAAIVLVASGASALAQDLAAGENSFRKCLPCHAVGEDAKNKVGPVLNGLEGRQSGSIEGYSYTEANKNSGIAWDEATFTRIHRGSARQDPGNQDGVRGHQERKRNRRPVGLSQAVRRRGKEEVNGPAGLTWINATPVDSNWKPSIGSDPALNEPEAP